jgi:hypothetical protein
MATTLWTVHANVCYDNLELGDDKFFFLHEGIVNDVIVPPEVIIPQLGQENAITLTVETYQIDEVRYSLIVFLACFSLCVAIYYLMLLFSSQLTDCKNFVYLLRGPSLFTVPIGNVF